MFKISHCLLMYLGKVVSSYGLHPFISLYWCADINGLALPFTAVTVSWLFRLYHRTYHGQCIQNCFLLLTSPVFPSLIIGGLYGNMWMLSFHSILSCKAFYCWHFTPKPQKPAILHSFLTSLRAREWRVTVNVGSGGSMKAETYFNSNVLNWSTMHLYDKSFVNA